MIINPWTYYIINEPEKVPDITPRSKHEMYGCIAIGCGWLISTVIFVILSFMIFMLNHHLILYFLCILVNSTVIYPVMIVTLCKVLCKIVDKKYGQHN